MVKSCLVSLRSQADFYFFKLSFKCTFYSSERVDSMNDHKVYCRSKFTFVECTNCEISSNLILHDMNSSCFRL